MPSRRVPIAAFALVLGILIGLGVLFAWRRSSSDASDSGSRIIAVLPFENLGDSADAYFADGVADEVRTKLAQVAGLEVIARGSVVEYRGTAKRPTEPPWFSAVGWWRAVTPSCAPARRGTCLAQ